MRSPELNLRRPWPEVRELLKENDYRITDDDLEFEPGHEQAMLDRLSSKLGKPVDEVKAYIESISSNRGKAS